MEYTHRYESPLGSMTMTSDGEALTGLRFDRQEHAADTYAEESLPVFEETVRWLDLYFSGRIPDFTPSLRMAGTPFRKAVWEILLTIPYGRTMTYGEVAAKIAEQQGRARMSAQAVGGAASRNPVALIVPCHRVIGSDGSLTGYAAGTDRKRRLLEMEKVLLDTSERP